MARARKTVLITGATDGIGRALAEIYRARDERLVLVGRRPLDSLEGVLYTEETYCKADLSKQDCADQVCSFLSSREIESLDLAIHNAATGYYGSVADQPGSVIREVVAVNLLAPLRLTHALVPHVKNTGGKHVLIGSIAHAFPCPEFAVYAATKEALDVFGRNLRVEGDVNVQVIHPGATQTGIHRKSGRRDGNTGAFPPAERVARRIARVIDGRRSVATIGLRNRWLRLCGRYCDGVIEALMRWRAK
ncbi:MAG: SDR family NAD(P)-dependent oxidoreductase [Gemmatimonadota bacterium]|nr:SDR family NAD(P)-dependent oxidoreductase [Gemmatimonadota bacterium]